MDRKRIIVFGVAVLCALTLAVAAASVAETNSSGTGPPTFDVERGVVGDVLDAVTFDVGLSLDPVLNVLVFVPGLVVLGLIARHAIEDVGVLELVAILPLVVVGALAMTAFPVLDVQQQLPGVGGGNGTVAEMSRVAGENRPEVTILLTPIVGGVLLVGIAVAVTVLSGGDDPESPSTEPFEASGPSELQSLGAAAGRAAERLDGEASFENAVYEAWTRMTRSLAVEDPETTTPGEFAEYAVEAGLAPEDVRELTELFEIVRYGRTPVTEERRERAQAALERIEAGYGGESDE